MLEKLLLHQLLRTTIRHGGLRVCYWDGSTHDYGSHSELTIQLNKPEAARAILTRGSLGLGESYVNGALDFVGPIGHLVKIYADNPTRECWLDFARFFCINHRNRPATQRQQIQHHYDIGNDFYRLWLDDSMTYSAAYFRTEHDTLEMAQRQKRQHILRKLQLAPGMRLLDIGSGWGQLLLTAARAYRVQCLGITLSMEQFELSNRRAQVHGLEHLVRFELMNYQDLAKTDQKFDRIVSVGMFEHVGRENQDRYFQVIQKMLKPDGLSLLHTISAAEDGPINPWIDHYIFPGGYIPSYPRVITQSVEHGFSLLDYEDLRMHYAMTLDAWLARFEKNVETVRRRYGDRFVRLWRYYLAISAGAFRFRRLNLSQMVLGGPEFVGPLTREHLYLDHNLGDSQRHKRDSISFHQ